MCIFIAILYKDAYISIISNMIQKLVFGLAPKYQFLSHVRYIRGGAMSRFEGDINFQEEIRDNVLIVYIQGRLDVVSSPVAEKRVFDHINNGQYKLLLDFSKVDYISSAGMRMLLSTTKKLKSHDGRLVLCSIAPHVMELCKMSGFDRFLEVTSTQEEALHKF